MEAKVFRIRQLKPGEYCSRRGCFQIWTHMQAELELLIIKVHFARRYF